MHDIMPPVAANAQLIQSYSADGFRIGNAMYHTHVLVLPTATFAWNGEWTMDALGPVFTAAEPTEILLMGTGARHEMLDPELRKTIKARGVGVDTMDSGAACRTFNVLLGESRRVAVALRLPS